jgi:hypothetical protein
MSAYRERSFERGPGTLDDLGRSIDRAEQCPNGGNGSLLHPELHRVILIAARTRSSLCSLLSISRSHV